ncbi:hypothetical protein AOLI_G00092020 [Acnodon oligacanthus]
MAEDKNQEGVLLLLLPHPVAMELDATGCKEICPTRGGGQHPRTLLKLSEVTSTTHLEGGGVPSSILLLACTAFVQETEVADFEGWAYAPWRRAGPAEPAAECPMRLTCLSCEPVTVIA